MHEMTEIIEEKSFDRKLSFLVETTGEFLLDITHALLTTEFTCFLENVTVFSFFLHYFCTVFRIRSGSKDHVQLVSGRLGSILKHMAFYNNG